MDLRRLAAPLLLLLTAACSRGASDSKRSETIAQKPALERTTVLLPSVAPARNAASVPVRQSSSAVRLASTTYSSPRAPASAALLDIEELVGARGFARASANVPRATEQDPASGSSDAPVTALVFGDLECPYTAQSIATLRTLQAAYGPTALRLVWKNRPLEFHRRAVPAARAAEAVRLVAGGEALWRFLDSAAETKTTLDDAHLAEWASTQGVTEETYGWLTRQGTGELDAKISDDLTAADAARVRGVPAVWIGARRLDGAQPLEAYAGAIDAELANGDPPEGVVQ